MTIAELFVNLGVKGADKTKNSLGEVRSTLGEIGTKSIAVKAGILGVIYGLQRLMSNSAAAGSSLMSYAGATGLSAETLQRWQYAARQANVGAEEMENSITGLQSAMIKMSMGQGVPAGMGVISNAVGIDQGRVRDTMYMMKKLSEYAQKEGNVDFANEQLKSFGLSLEMISAMRRNAFSDKNLLAAPIYSNAEADKLQRVNVAWANLGQQFEMAMGHLNAKHGLSLVKDLSAVSKQLIHMLTLFSSMIEKTSALKAIGKIFEGWGNIFSLIEGGAGALNELMAKQQEQNEKDSGGKDKGLIPSWDTMKKRWNDSANASKAPTLRELITPKAPKISQNPNVMNNTNNTNVVAHITGVKDGKDAADHLKKHINKTARQIPSQGRAN